MKTKVNRSTRTERSTWIEIGMEELREMLIRKYPLLAEEMKKENSEFQAYFQVPGGGDWSGERIHIDRDNCIHVGIVSSQVQREEKEEELK